MLQKTIVYAVVPATGRVHPSFEPRQFRFHLLDDPFRFLEYAFDLLHRKPPF